MNVIPFQFQSAHVRLLEIDNEPWFVAKDVAELLGYSNTSKAVNSHCKAIQTCPTEMGGQVRHMQIIPERDVYRLIMRSKLPEAEQFEEWIVADVLPSIRKTGQYATAKPAELSRMDLIQLALDAEQEKLALQYQMEQVAPKVEAFDRIAAAEGSLCVTDAAKDLQVRPKDLFSWLSENKWIYRRTGKRTWISYQDKIQRGLLEHKITTIDNGDGMERTIEQVRVTPRGLTYLACHL